MKCIAQNQKRGKKMLTSTFVLLLVSIFSLVISRVFPRIPEIQNDFYHNFRYRIFTRCFAVEREYLQKAVEEGRIETAYAAKLYQEVLLAEAMLVDNREEE
jgi:hypothetical protein